MQHNEETAIGKFLTSSHHRKVLIIRDALVTSGEDANWDPNRIPRDIGAIPSNKEQRHRGLAVSKKLQEVP